jgi:signal transduction histidine kinase
VILALVLLVLLPSLLYLSGTLRTAGQIARQDALMGNLATAQMGARLIDAQCGTAMAVVRALARQRPLAAALQRCPPEDGGRAGRPSAERAVVDRYLHDAVELVPDITLLAAYSPDGQLLAAYPRTPVAPRDAHGEEWFQRCLRERGPIIGEAGAPESGPAAPAIFLAVPVGTVRRPVGWVMAPLAPAVIENWLRPLRIGNGVIVYVVDPEGHVVANSGGSRYPVRSLGRYRPVRLALAGGQGTSEGFSPIFRQAALVGFAPALGPRWAVIAAQPEAAALAPAHQLLRRLSLYLLPVLGIILGAGRAMERMHLRQARLARENAELSRELDRQNQELRAADQARSGLLANVSHELRTPLASIKASVSGLLEPDIEWDQEALRGFLILVHEEIDRLAAQVRNLLDMSRIEAGMLPLEKTACDLAEIIDSALERMEPLTRGWTIQIDLAPEPLLIEADYTQIETVILNLLENAVKYTSPGTTLHLRAAVGRAPAGPPERRVLFSLGDEGPGVRPEDQPRIFDKFYRGAASPRTRGTGLGLAICRALIQAHGGTIDIRSTPGGGAEFWFSLPLLEPSGAEDDPKGGGDESEPCPGRRRRPADPADAARPVVGARLPGAGAG